MTFLIQFKFDTKSRWYDLLIIFDRFFEFGWRDIGRILYKFTKGDLKPIK